jgi:hypothetical protein
MQDCGRRADYFWHAGFPPAGISWFPVCAGCANEMGESLVIVVSPIAESGALEYLGSSRFQQAESR